MQFLLIEWYYYGCPMLCAEHDMDIVVYKRLSHVLYVCSYGKNSVEEGILNSEKAL